jgi:hypothetical protein
VLNRAPGRTVLLMRRTVLLPALLPHPDRAPSCTGWLPAAPVGSWFHRQAPSYTGLPAGSDSKASSSRSSTIFVARLAPISPRIRVLAQSQFGPRSGQPARPSPPACSVPPLAPCLCSRRPRRRSGVVPGRPDAVGAAQVPFGPRVPLADARRAISNPDLAAVFVFRGSPMYFAYAAAALSRPFCPEWVGASQAKPRSAT